MKEMLIDSKCTGFCLSLAKGLSLWSVPSFMDHLQAISSDTVFQVPVLSLVGAALKLCGLDREQVTT